MIQIFVDADGCPVKQEACRVAKRYGLRLCFVSNSWMRISEDDLIRLVLVDKGFDAVDDWIVDHVTADDIVISADIPLASRCLEKGARVLSPKGRLFTRDSIGNALANRELMAYLRDLGEITGGPAPFEKRDRSRFLQKLDEVIHAALKGKASNLS